MSPKGVSRRVYYIYRREMTSNGVGDKNSSTTIDITFLKLRILNSGKEILMLPLTKLVRSVGSDFRGEEMVQTVTWLSHLLKEFAI